MANPAAANPRNQIIAGRATTYISNGVTITFPSEKFCVKYVDDNFLTKIDSIAAGGRSVAGGVIYNGRRVSHQHVEHTIGVAYVWLTDTQLEVVAYGTKVSKGVKDSGNYNWVVK